MKIALKRYTLSLQRKLSDLIKGCRNMSIALGELIQLINGQLIGDSSLICLGANPPEDAMAGEITMLDSPSRADLIRASNAIAVITSEPLDDVSIAQIIVTDPHAAFSTAVQHFRPTIQKKALGNGISETARISDSAEIHPTAIIGDGVEIGERTRVFPGVVIMPESVIGDDCTIYPNVTLYEYTQIRDRVVIHAGCTLGANGFGYRQEQGKHIPAAQLGYVKIESDVELGASVTIDRGSYGATTIGEGTKIDNQVMIAHNCKIGRHNLICSQVGIAGSSKTGDYVVLAGQVGLKDHISLGDHTIVGAQAGVMDDCEGNEVYLGSPATLQREQMQIMAVERRLPEMRKELKTLKREMERLKGQLQQDPSNASVPKENQKVA